MRSAELFPARTEIPLWIPEGDSIKRTAPDRFIMIGVDGEIYHSTEEDPRKNCDLTDEAFSAGRGLLWIPKAYHAAAKEVEPPTPRPEWARRKTARGSGPDSAAWRSWLLGERGDWLICREGGRTDAYIIRKSIFQRTELL